MNNNTPPATECVFAVPCSCAIITDAKFSHILSQKNPAILTALLKIRQAEEKAGNIERVRELDGQIERLRRRDQNLPGRIIEEKGK